jgi:thiamine biosynthesis protein ThiS
MAAMSSGDGAPVQIHVNGRAIDVPESSTLAALLATLGQDPRTVAIERNGELVRRAQFEATAVRPGDRVEIVRFVQGG